MEADFTALIDELFVESRSVDNSPSPRLDAACVKYLEARGFVCLRKHTEAPKEEGWFAVVDVTNGVTLSMLDDAFRTNICMDLRRKAGHEVYAIGPMPLPEGK